MAPESPERPSRQRATRYPLQLAVDAGGRRGLTRDISTTGVLFETAEGTADRWAEGQPLQLMVELPPATGGETMRLEVVGRVTRMESTADGRLLVAVVATDLGFVVPPADEGVH